MTLVQHRLAGFVAAAALLGAVVLNIYWLTSISSPDPTKSQRRSGLSPPSGGDLVRHQGGKAKQDLDQRIAEHRNLIGEWEAAIRITQDNRVNPELKALKQAEAQKLVREIKALEREIDEFRRRREQRRQEQAVGLRKGLLDDISQRAGKNSRQGNYDLESARPGVSPSGVKFLLHSRDAVDFSNEVLAELNKNARKDTDLLVPAE